MKMHTFVKPHQWLASVFFIAVISPIISTANAQTLTDQGHNLGSPCTAQSVSDTGLDVGTCESLSGAGPAIPFYNDGNGDVALALPATGESCESEALATEAVIVGACQPEAGSRQAAVWNINNPLQVTVLQPYSLASVINDVSTSATAFDASGNIAGQSISGDGKATAVLWLAGSSTPILVSTLADNCKPVGMINGSSAAMPEVVLNCPTSHGTVAKYATGKTANLLGVAVATTYSVSDLPVAAGYTNCVATDASANRGIGGVCYVADGANSAAYWATSNAAPILLSAYTDTALNSRAEEINNNGHLMVSFIDKNGKSQVGLWTAGDATPTFTQVPPTACSTQAAPADLALNADVIALNVLDCGQHSQAAVWKPGQSVAILAGDEAGGASSHAQALSENGAELAVDALDANGTEGSAVTTVP